MMPLNPQAPYQPHCRLTWLLGSVLLLGVLYTVSPAQTPTVITSDGTLGTTVTQSGSVHDITGGTIKGSNLFHSFHQFSLGTNDIASFNGPGGIANILSRVTGGQASFIDGLVRSTIPGANLYLLNPSGVLLGPHASLDVSGAFHLSTAEVLRFADGATFAANLNDQSVLSAAAPAAFGFLQANPAAITIEGSVLQVVEGETLSVVGGDVQIADGTLYAPAGRVNIASVASAGEVVPELADQPPDLEVASFTTLGEIEMTQSTASRPTIDGKEVGNIDVSGAGGGTVVLRGGKLLLERSSIMADTVGNDAGRGIDIGLTDTLTLDQGGRMQATTQGKGQAGSIDVAAQSLTLKKGSQIDSGTQAAGGGGNLTITVTDAVTISGRDSEDNRSGLFSRSNGRGAAGNIQLSAATLTMNDGLVQTEARKQGRAGDVTVQVQEMTLTGGGQIDSSTRGDGRGGNVTVTATGALTFAGRRPSEGGGGGGGGGDGGGGEGRNASGIFSDSRGQGDAGNVSVAAAMLDLNDGRISAFTRAGGDGGDIDLQVERLTLTAGSQIGSRAEDVGQGGNVTISAKEIVIDDQSQISAISLGERLQDALSEDPEVGKSGTIVLTASDILRIQNGGFLTVETAQANAGSITLNVGFLVYLQSQGAINTSAAGGAGNGGDITIDPEFVILADSQIVAQAFVGQGGNIRIEAGVFLADPTSQVSASSALGIDGEVDIRAAVTNLSDVLTPLPERAASSVVLLYDQCVVRLRQGTVSSFVMRGRDGVPANPEGLLPSRPSRSRPATATHAEAGPYPKDARRQATTRELHIERWLASADATHVWELACRVQ